jgi:hypothetical protein
VVLLRKSIPQNYNLQTAGEHSVMRIRRLTMDSEFPKIDRFERAKLLHDYFKYLATLSTGSTAFLVTFSKNFEGDQNNALNWFVATLVSFMTSAVSSVFAQTAYIWYASSPGSILGNKYLYVVGLLGSLIGFVLGVLFLVIFAIHRL